MSCACKPIVIPNAKSRRQLKGDAEEPGVEVAGTWDFKWPRNTVIRVAFQEPGGYGTGADPARRADFEQIRALIIEYASRWPIRVISNLGGKGSMPSGGVSGISLHFLDETLDEPLGRSAVLGSDHNSPFLLPKDGVILAYDVLINLEDLPLARIDPFRFQGTPPTVDAPSSPGRERVLLPLSELGSYARRADYGSPTAFLGRFGVTTKKKSLLEHIESTLGQHVVVHEFGHILGLPHEHQNPKYAERPYLPAKELVREIRDGFELLQSPTEDEVTVQVRDPWPGSLEFSDWGDPPKGATLYDLKSVMTYPYHQNLLVPSELGGAKAAALTARQTSTGNAKTLVSPEPVDIDNLRRMYGARSRAGAQERAAE